MKSEVLYKMIRVAYGYGDDIPDSLIEYGIKRFDFAPIISLYKAGYRLQPKGTDKPSTTAKKATAKKKE
jgi:hypothetical protein